MNLPIKIEKSVCLSSLVKWRRLLSQKGMIGLRFTHGQSPCEKTKPFHFLESAKGKTDYDNMKIHSLVDTVANATINFKKNTMIVHGVDEFKIRRFH